MKNNFIHGKFYKSTYIIWKSIQNWWNIMSIYHKLLNYVEHTQNNPKQKKEWAKRDRKEILFKQNHQKKNK